MVSSRLMVLLLGAVVVVIATSPATAQEPGSSGMLVVGAITCNKSGNPLSQLAGAGIKVDMICNGSLAGSSITGINGAFVIYVYKKIVNPGPTGCFAQVPLPIPRCPNLPSTGALRGNVTAMAPIIPHIPATGCIMAW